MEPAEYEVGEKSKDRARKARRAQDRGPHAGPSFDKTSMQIGRINKPDDKGADFLRVPAPEAAPRLLRPYGPGEKRAHGEERISHADRLVCHTVKGLRFGKPRRKP